MADLAFFRRDRDTFLPLPAAVGYWTADSIQGRALIGLLGQEIERRHGESGLIPVRLTVDMHRLARMGPVEIATRVIRDGGRLRLIEATLLCEGSEYARATCQFLRATAAPAGRVWPGVPAWDVPPPDALPTLPDPEHKRLSDWRVIAGEIGVFGPRRMWMRERITIVEGEALTPFARVAVGADLASPVLHASDAGIFYINSDVTVQLHRLPQGEWLGLDALLHDAAQGIAVGQCRIYDETGPLGTIGVTALSNQRG
jgi:hypothetical protein